MQRVIYSYVSYVFWGYMIGFDEKQTEILCIFQQTSWPCARLLCLFHIYPVNLVVNERKRKLICFSLRQANGAIVLKWKETQRPLPSQWERET